MARRSNVESLEEVRPTMRRLVVLLALSACSSSSTGTPGGSGVGPSGIVSSKPLGGLSDAEADRLCDWSVSLLGGYMKSYTCGDPNDPTLTSTADSQAECVSYFRACNATVGQVEQCAEQRAGDACAPAPECASIENCQTHSGAMAPSSG